MKSSFVGIDLAWSVRRPSGAAVLDETGTVLEARADLGGDDEVLAFIRRYAAPIQAVALDIPIIVINPSGRRAAEAETARLFRRFEAAPHPTNRAKPEFRDGGRGLHLVQALARDGFHHTPHVPPRGRGRYVFEVFPHPAHVVLFGLDRTLKYKKKKGRDWTTVYAEWNRYRRYLLHLARATPPLRLPPRLRAALPRDIATATTPGHYKAYDDLLDGIFCAYLAAYIWHWGPARNTVFGNLADGYIVTPIDARLRLLQAPPAPPAPATRR